MEEPENVEESGERRWSTGALQVTRSLSIKAASLAVMGIVVGISMVVVGVLYFQECFYSRVALFLIVMGTGSVALVIILVVLIASSNKKSHKFHLLLCIIVCRVYFAIIVWGSVEVLGKLHILGWVFRHARQDDSSPREYYHIFMKLQVSLTNGAEIFSVYLTYYFTYLNHFLQFHIQIGTERIPLLTFTVILSLSIQLLSASCSCGS